MMKDFVEGVLPGVTHWNHPGFLAYFAITGSGPGILGEMLSSALNLNAMVWRSSPAATELEEVVTDWTRDLLGLPPGFAGVINDTASHSSLYALAAARAQAYPEVRDQGLFGLPQGRVYASEHAHSSIDKSIMTLGLGRDGLAHIRADGEFRMIPGDLVEALESDLEQGVRPVAIVGAAGTTSTSSMDPLGALADVAERFGVWFHVDAAYAGPAAALPEARPLFEGWERAQSIVVNPHKWMFTPVDCSILFCRRPERLRDAFSLTPAYLETTEQGQATNLMDYGLALGRRFRALKLWFVLRYFGQEGIRDRLRAHCDLARGFAERVAATPGWSLAAPVPFSTVCFRFEPEGRSPEAVDGLNRNIVDEVNRTGDVFLSHTELDGRFTIRLSVGNLRTTPETVDHAWALLQEAAAAR
jgi:aromatic-L-amino-acid decarboxylase